jgi:probable F420-dependent oxidoreductase
LKIGLAASMVGERLTPEHLSDLARGAEVRGFESIWMGEHVVEMLRYDSRYPYTPDGRLPDLIEGGMAAPLMSLAFAAACTSTIRLGTAVCVLPQRSPLYFAKDVTTLDRLSGGRVELGIGIGWQREEFAACNVPWPARGRRADEYIEILKRLWSGQRVEFAGEFWTLPACVQQPVPSQRPHPPLHVAGESDAALRRAARLAQGWIGYLAAERVAERVARLEGFLREQGRERGSLEISIVPLEAEVDLDMIKRLGELGVDRVHTFAVGLRPDDVGRDLDRLASGIVEPARAL